MPEKGIETLIEAAGRLGFSLAGSEVEYHHGRIVQELSFRPPYGQSRVNELEMVMLPAPGGGESLEAVGERMRAWAEGLPSGQVTAFTHGAALRALLCVLFGWPATPQPGYVLPFPYLHAHTGITRLERRGGGWTLLSYNDHAHLEG